MDNHSVSADTVVTTSTAGTTNLANVVVAVRIRPLSSTEVSSGVKTCCQVIGDKVVAIRKNGDAMQYLKSQQLSINEYGYDVVFDESSAQHQVFEKTAKPYISRLLDGQNVTVFAYGATGAGKTHTMLGNTRQDAAASRAEAGIIPNSVQELFTLINKRLTNKSTAHRIGESYQVYLSFLEVYNEQVFDLLDSSGKVLSVREDQEKGIVVVAGITEQQVNTYDQVIDFILQGNRRRKTEATMANAVSSRSHAVLQLVVKHSFRQENGREATIESKLSLIDLAGSERASATNNRGVRLQEGASINKSLLALANCINALAENSTVSGTSGSGTSTSTITSSTTTTVKKLTNVKYRDSKLTHLLKSSLEGNCNLIMIANINPSDSTYEDSHNTLKYANRAKNIKVNPLVNREMITKGHHHTEKDHQNWIEREMKLREENHQLKKIVQNLEEKVKELERFKHMVLQNGGMIPSDYLDIEIMDVNLIQSHHPTTLTTANRDSTSSDSFVTTNDEGLDDSMSSLSTAAEEGGEVRERLEEPHLSDIEEDIPVSAPAMNLLASMNAHLEEEKEKEGSIFLPKKADHEPVLPSSVTTTTGASSLLTNATVGGLAARKRRVSHLTTMHTSTPAAIPVSTTSTSASIAIASSVASRSGVTTRRQSMAIAPTPRENNFMAPTAASTSRTEKAKNPFDLLVSGKMEDSAARHHPVVTASNTVASRRPGTRQSLSAVITSTSSVNLISTAMDRMDKSSETVMTTMTLPAVVGEKVVKKARKEVDSPGTSNAIVTSPIALLHPSMDMEGEEEIRLEEFETSMNWLAEEEENKKPEEDADATSTHVVEENTSKKRKSVSCTTIRRKSMAKVAAMLDCLAQEVTFDFDFTNKFNVGGVANSIATNASVASSVNTNFIGLKTNASVSGSVAGEEKGRRVTRSMQSDSTTPLAPVAETSKGTMSRRKSVSSTHSINTAKGKEKVFVNNENAENFKMEREKLQMIDI